MSDHAAKPSTIPVPVRSHALGMGAVTVAAIGLVGICAAAMGGEWRTVVLASAAMAIASVASFIPALLSFRVNAENFGMMVLGGSILRLLMLGSVGLGFAALHGVDGRPFWIALAAGGGLVLVVETALAVMILSRVERGRVARQGALNAAQVH